MAKLDRFGARASLAAAVALVTAGAGCGGSSPLPASDGGGGAGDAGVDAMMSIDLASPQPDAGGREVSFMAECLRPSQCQGGAPICCFRYQVQSMSGSSMCSASCPGGFNGVTFTTKACATTADCAGYQGQGFGMSTPWTSCCSLMGISVCLDEQTAAAFGAMCMMPPVADPPPPERPVDAGVDAPDDVPADTSEEAGVGDATTGEASEGEDGGNQEG